MLADLSKKQHVMILLCLAIVPPALMWLALTLPEILEVATTGLCPAAPPDIPAYKCSVGEFILRMTLGPFALMGTLVLFLGWGFSGFPLLTALYWGVFYWQKKQKT